MTIWARHRPPRTTSNVAAAFWFPYAVHPRTRVVGWARESYRRFAELLADPAAGVRMRPVLELGRRSEPHSEPHSGQSEPWWAGAVAGVRPARPDELPEGFAHGHAFDAPVIDTRAYMPWLLARVQELGVQIEDREVRHLDEALAEDPLVVDCAGLGARELASDPRVFPIRGQLVHVRDPGLDRVLVDEEGPEGIAYMVPRGDDVVLGGTSEPHDDDLRVRPEDTAGILQRCARLDARLTSAVPLAQTVGLRPGRDEVRLEAEPRPGGGTVIHDYGHGGAGVTLSWGCAAEVLTLAEAALRRGTGS